MEPEHILSEKEKQIQQAANEYARKNKKTIARRLTDESLYIPEEEPVSVFMAGSPGAGKTEASIELIEHLVKTNDDRILRIDPDELRNELPGYTGENSWLFQTAISILVEKIHDMALRQQQSFILDGTFSNYDKAKHNIERSLAKKRFVQILYVYQDPFLAWEFVQAREKAEGRRIRPEDFIHQYFEARNVVNSLKVCFGKNIHIDLLLKNIDNTHRLYKAGIDQIDKHVPEKYTPADLEQLLKLA